MTSEKSQGNPRFKFNQAQTQARVLFQNKNSSIGKS